MLSSSDATTTSRTLVHVTPGDRWPLALVCMVCCVEVSAIILFSLGGGQSTNIVTLMAACGRKTLREVRLLYGKKMVILLSMKRTAQSTQPQKRGPKPKGYANTHILLPPELLAWAKDQPEGVSGL